MTRHTFLVISGAVLLFTGLEQNALGHGTPIQLSAVDGRLQTDEPVYESTFEEPDFPLPSATDEPGVDAVSGISVADQVYLEVTSPLWFSTGTSEGSAVVPTGTLTIIGPNDGQDYYEYNVTGTIDTLAGMLWLPHEGQVDHAHGLYVLSDEGTDGTGVYGLQLQFSSPQFASSDPFLLLLATHDFDEADFDAASAQIFAAVPVLGDMNGDRLVNQEDVPLFVEALVNRPAYNLREFEFPVDADVNGDLNDDGRFDLGDLGSLANLLAGGGSAEATTVPEPGVALMAMTATLMHLLFHRRSKVADGRLRRFC